MTNEFLELVRPQTVISKLNLRAVPLNVRVLRELGGAVGYWVGEGMPAPLTSNAFDTVTLPPVKVGALAVLTKETINAPLSQAEPEVLKSLVSAAAEKANEYFLDDSGGKWYPTGRHPKQRCADCVDRRRGPGSGPAD